MKKIITSSFILFIILFLMNYETVACADSPSYISGPSDIEKENATAPSPSGYTYVMNMSSGYRESAGGYTNTEWTFQGLGVVGYGETLTLSTAGWTLGYGTYTLTAKNQFGGSGNCFGCITNSTFTYSVTLHPNRPDLVIEMTSTLPSSLNESPSTYQVNYKITNNGTAASPSMNVKIYWTKQRSQGIEQFDSNSEPVNYSIPPGGGTYTVNNVTMYTPGVLATEEWTLNFFVDNYNGVAEQNESNNIKTYNRTINNTGRKFKRQGDGPVTSMANVALVTDLSGTIIWKEGGVPFDFTKLNSGLYVFKVRDGNNLITTKIFKD